MTRDDQAVVRRRSRLNAGAGGVASGASFVALGHQLGDHTLPGQILIWIAPLAAVLLGAAIEQLGLWAIWTRESVVVWKARRTLVHQLNDPNTSPEHKAKIRAMLEQVDSLIAQAEVDRLRKLTEIKGNPEPEPT